MPMGLEWWFDCSVNIFCSYAESVGAVHYTASAKQNKGIQELFLDISKSKFQD